MNKLEHGKVVGSILRLTDEDGGYEEIEVRSDEDRFLWFCTKERDPFIIEAKNWEILKETVDHLLSCDPV